MNSHSQAHDDNLDNLTRQKVSWLLRANIVNPFIQSEEERHPWQVSETQKLDFPLLRIWDVKSGSHPDKDNHMLSRSPRLPLTTEQARKTSLAIHLNHRIWRPTPYISFTKSASAIENLAKWRSIKRGNQTLTVIDPATRLKNGLPILDIAAEMKHYEIPDPYNKGMEYYTDHYVCLWEVTTEEIVGHYEWEVLANNKDWFDDIIAPEFRKFKREKKSESASTRPSAFDMSTIMESLSAARISIDTRIEHLEDSDDSSEHHYLDDNCTDSDDDAEEAYPNDDIIKAIEDL
ncbi:hypothetical protein COCC4DRAFT_82748 [Bipolaris maydis ATCC 48331]|uniref:DUF7587 domain-containing protein n=2 Tax=Cochliobolus heterostrophus TaxID=5016 RepID=M2UFF7_COCH5|nr:uncharacterized protein COCC4DRAFT_82748 [Bipolaris maydis ATCC 48331]EMD86662.1 hypothetical protein COCHEDRAFT_1185799 [Bipolaris maydis C5]KAJ5052600.1 hypothetical protein J3E74DRAFT_256523 [Bipolaris maydis]ENI03059.1 hypothetical protein COCC4DRAFT_82748 [Bipolaris maydis ATCC 48331]KAJ6192273.1 hypothetical protein J3E72DRAFT_253851 [Bipolaris maydis]KAJ6203748.1 hypothetical protein PSV09DRAFT_1185799 [Bipolaris maydis]